MQIADLHIHSCYSRATSRDLTPEYLDLWARRKGIHLIGTGDFTHPKWREMLKEKLRPAEDGLYTLKEEYRIDDGCAADSFCPRFVVTGEISSIYKKYDRVRKVHSVIMLPGLEQAEMLSQKLETIGNIHSDGRPILGLDCRDLLEITLELCPKAIYVPAHIWTPHFSLFGAFSGFDTVHECYEDMTPYIHAVETGLSSDPPMNWRVSALDCYQLISNSDAHSPAKLGREANLLDIDCSYSGLYEAIQTGRGLCGTIEFFPEEGKYHYDGHRRCNVCLSPAEAMSNDGKCPVCGRRLTIGVSHRIEQLADQPEGRVRPQAKPFESLVPLPEVIAASTGHSAASVKVTRQYEEMLRKLGPEFEILRNVPLEDIQRTSGSLIARGIGRLRCGQVERIPGFDGEYGTIRLFSRDELENTDGQLSFFAQLPGAGPVDGTAAQHNDPGDGGIMRTVPCAEPDENMGEKAAPAGQALNPGQMEAVTALNRHIAVIAGPGTGKTKTLIARIAYLLETRRVKPSMITAVTFTNKAAGELRERLGQTGRTRRSLKKMHIGTFHALCLELLIASGRKFVLADTPLASEIAGEIIVRFGLPESAAEFLQKVSYAKSRWPAAGPDSAAKEAAATPDSAAKEAAAAPDSAVKEAAAPKSAAKEAAAAESAAADAAWAQAFYAYNERLHQAGALDFDDLILETIRLCEHAAPNPAFSYMLVDEFQDISPAQYALIKALNQGGRELFVIGDSDQAIYGFRGADSGCFDRLSGEFSDTRVIHLEENYRCTPPILDCALGLISHNPGGARCLHANAPDGPMVRVVAAKSPMAQAIFAARQINRYIGGIDMLDAQEKAVHRSGARVRSFGEIAVLYRTHHQARLLEEALGREGIPYIVAGRDDFLKDPKVEGSLAFFDWLFCPENTLALTTAMKLLNDLEENALTRELFETLRAQFGPAAEKSRPGKLLAAWIEAMHLENNEAMEKLQKTALCYKTMQEFMNGMQLGAEGDVMRCGSKTYNGDAVTLMTLHGSKGLEFPAVIICGVQKGVLPYESGRHPSDEEEERRLLFVGMTRAREELVLTWTAQPSPFLEELDPNSMIHEDAGHSGKQKSEPQGRQMSLFDFIC